MYPWTNQGKVARSKINLVKSGHLSYQKKKKNSLCPMVSTIQALCLVTSPNSIHYQAYEITVGNRNRKLLFFITKHPQWQNSFFQTVDYITKPTFGVVNMQSTEKSETRQYNPQVSDIANFSRHSDPSIMCILNDDGVLCRIQSSRHLLKILRSK